jgi:ElaB/YqjD/DUF883 family membrane-anchored ribosome-binding protein
MNANSTTSEHDRHIAGAGDANKGKPAGRGQGRQESAADTADDYGSSAQEKVGEAYQEGRKRLADVYDAGSEAANSALEWAGERGNEMADYTRDRMRSGRRSMETYFEDNPLMIGAVGLGVGLILGALLPLTSRERRLFEPLGEEMRRTVRSQGAGAVKAVRRQVEQAGKQVSSSI